MSTLIIIVIRPNIWIYGRIVFLCVEWSCWSHSFYFVTCQIFWGARRLKSCLDSGLRWVWLIGHWVYILICGSRRQLWLSSPTVVIDEGELLARGVTCGGSLVRCRPDSCLLRHLVADIPRIERLRFGGWTTALWPPLKLRNLRIWLVFI